MRVIYGVVVEDGKVVRKPIVLKKRKCRFCGKKYDPKRQDSKFCSRKCGKAFECKKNSVIYRLKAKKWYENNKDRAIESRRKKYWSNPGFYRAKSREYVKKNREKVRAANILYKDKTRHGGKREKLINKNGLICDNCGKIGDRFDIIAHHESFDKFDHDNQVLLCRSCHAKIHKLSS